MVRAIFTFILVIFISGHSVAQLTKISTPYPKGIHTLKGDYLFDYKLYNYAIAQYELAYVHKPNDIHAILQLGESYYQLKDYANARVWFEMAFKLSSEVEAEYHLHYAITLLTLNDHKASLPLFESYKALTAQQKVSDTEEYIDTTYLVVSPINICNSPQSELSPVVFNNKMYFTTNRKASDQKDNYSIYTAAMENGKVISTGILNDQLNVTGIHRSFGINAATKELYFTQQTAKGEVFQYTQLPEAVNQKLKVKPVSVKDNNQAIYYPTFNSKGTVMYFAALNGPNGYDIYKCTFENKMWSTPTRLGAEVNTRGDEIYPNLSDENTLIFSSNGHKGLGEFDLFVADMGRDKVKVSALPSPINSPYNDFSYVKTSENQPFILCSDRPGGSGQEDLYFIHQFKVRQKVEPIHQLIIPSEIPIYLSNGEYVIVPGTQNGDFVFSIKTGLDYHLIIERDNFQTPDAPTAANLSELTFSNTYNFFIQRYVEASTTGIKGSNSTTVQSLSFNPGDLITFQLKPNENYPSDAERTDTDIIYKNEELGVSSYDTLVFGYVVEELERKEEAQEDALLAADSPKPEEVIETQANEMVGDTTPVETTKLSELPIDDAPVAAMSEPADSSLLSMNDEPEPPKPEEKVSESDSNIEKPAAEVQAPAVIAPSAIAVAEIIPPADTEEEITEPTPPVNEPAEEVQEEPMAEQAIIESEELQVTPTTEPEPIVTEQVAMIEPISEEPVSVKEPVEENLSPEPESIVVQTQAEPTPAVAPEPMVEDQVTEISSNNNEITPEAVIINSMEETSAISEQHNDLQESQTTTTPAPMPEPKPEPKANVEPVETIESEEDYNRDFQYRVQIAASRKPLSEEVLQKIYSGDREIKHFNEEGYDKYYIAQVSSYFAARDVLASSGVDKAFIAAYEGDTKWKLKDAIAAQYKDKMKQSGLKASDNVIEVIMVNFDFDEYTLVQSELDKLHMYIENNVKTNPDRFVIVNGHTDLRGSNSYNYGLSEERALFVRDRIIEEGIDPERVQVHYFGKTQLMKNCDDNDDCDESIHRVNRRVELILLETKK